MWWQSSIRRWCVIVDSCHISWNFHAPKKKVNLQDLDSSSARIYGRNEGKTKVEDDDNNERVGDAVETGSVGEWDEMRSESHSWLDRFQCPQQDWLIKFCRWVWWPLLHPHHLSPTRLLLFVRTGILAFLLVDLFFLTFVLSCLWHSMENDRERYILELKEILIYIYIIFFIK